MSRNYNETDLNFYQEVELKEFAVREHSLGRSIEWLKQEGVGGYAIYKKEGSSEWRMLQTVGEHTVSFIDRSPFYPGDDYKVTAIVEGDLFVEATASEIDEENQVHFFYDLAVTKDHESARQDLTNRMRTQKGQWRSHPELGANLELLEGEPNTRKTAYQGVEMIQESLSYGSRFNEKDYMIKPVPTSIQEIDFYVLLESDESEPLLVKKSLEL